MKNDFDTALQVFINEEKRFDSIVEKFNEFKKILDENIVKNPDIETVVVGPFYNRKTIQKKHYQPYVQCVLEKKIEYENNFYLLFHIHTDNYVMYMKNGEVFFIPPISLGSRECYTNEKALEYEDIKQNSVYSNYSGLYHHEFFHVSKSITVVQLFSILIRKYKENLKIYKL